MHVDRHVNDDNDNDDDIFFGWLRRSTNKLLQLIVHKNVIANSILTKMLMNECLFI